MAEVQPKWDATRIFIVVIVAVFIVSSLTLSILAIIQLTKGDETADSTTTNTQTQEGKLQGTKLEDFTPVATVDKLQIIDIKEGTGDAVQAGATVTAHYTGALASDGTIFQSSKDFGQPVTFPLGNVIKGWQDGVPGMKVGGVRRLVIPAADAYGAQAQDGIPANSNLVFDIELTKIGE